LIYFENAVAGTAHLLQKDIRMASEWMDNYAIFQDHAAWIGILLFPDASGALKLLTELSSKLQR
jgi:hypothetical protein